MTLTGVAASPGIAIGPAVILRRGHPPARAPLTPPEEQARLARAAAATRRQLSALAERIEARAGAKEAGIFRTHVLMLDDPMLVKPIEDGIGSGLSAEQAVERSVEELAGRFRALPDSTLRERAADLLDIGQRLLANLSGARSTPAGAGILVAASVTPSEVDPDRVAAIATEHGGSTGHAAILARAMGIPAVAGVSGLLARVCDGDEIVVDGGRGEVLLRPDPETIESYRRRRDEERCARERLAALRDIPAVTLDGFRVELAANIAGLPDVSAALEAGAESIGVLRTEFLFLGRAEPPDEREQFEVYRDILSRMAPRRVTIRTLDAGADKELPFLALPKEENPALGLRGIRLSLAREPLFRAQLRALARAAGAGNLAVLLPMVSDLSEVRRTRELLGDAAIPLGVMIETPAAALMAEELAAEADFFSLGTNDLTQYVLAADRVSEQVAAHYQPLHPAVLRLIRHVSEAGARHRIPVAVCGEMAADPLAAVLLVGLGAGELSMSPPSIPAVKEAIRRWEKTAAVALAERALRSKTAAEVALELERCSRER